MLLVYFIPYNFMCVKISEQTPVGSCITTSIESPYESNQPELASQELCASPCTGDSSAGDGDIQRRKLCLDNINPIAGNNEPEIALCKSGEKYEAIDFVTNASAANAINPSESEDEDEVGWHIQPQPAQVRSSPKENFIKESTKERQIGAPLVGKRLVKGSDDVRPRLYDSFDMIFCAAYGPDGTNRFVYAKNIWQYVADMQ